MVCSYWLIKNKTPQLNCFCFLVVKISSRPMHFIIDKCFTPQWQHCMETHPKVFKLVTGEILLMDIWVSKNTLMEMTHCGEKMLMSISVALCTMYSRENVEKETFWDKTDNFMYCCKCTTIIRCQRTHLQIYRLWIRK